MAFVFGLIFGLFPGVRRAVYAMVLLGVPWVIWHWGATAHQRHLGHVWFWIIASLLRRAPRLRLVARTVRA